MPASNDQTEEALATTLLTNLAAFQSFARRRLGSDDLVADAVQESLLRALSSVRTPSPEGNVIAWFYRILRNVLIDLHRRRAVQVKALERFAAEQPAEVSEEDLEKTACACLHSLMPTLKPEYARVLQLADLEDKAPEVVAKQLGISRNNLKVRLHRARRQLRERLEQTCKLCATHGCLDCHCAPVS